MTRVELYNRALSKLGDRRYEPNTPSAYYLDMWRESSIRAIIEGPGRFSFTLARTDLQDNNDGAYPLPDDAIRLVSTGGDRFELVGDVIRADAGQIIPIVYISSSYASLDDLPDRHEGFNSAVVAMLAANVCVPVTGKHDLRNYLIQEAQMLRRKALHDDAVQYASNDQYPNV